MMAGNPNWWAMFPPSSSSSLFPPQFPPSNFSDHLQPHSWSHLLLGDEDRVINNQTQMGHYQPKKLENWEDQILNNNHQAVAAAPNFVDIVKQEVSNNKRDHSLILHPPSTLTSSSTSSHSNKFLNFSYNNSNPDHNINQSASQQHSPESNRSAASGGACKKARVHPPSSSQPPLKVRKEKLVDRITALHQIVSPFGKTDTASVLSEAIGYIRFLQGQIEALSYPYLRSSAPKDLRNSQQPALLNDSCLKRKATPNQGEEMMNQEKPLQDLRSRGLCLVPVSCTQLVGGDNNGAAYWAPAYSTGF